MIFRYSTITLAQTCLQKYKYHLDGVKSEEPESGDMAFGTALHLGLQASLEGEDGTEVFTTFHDSQTVKEMKYSRLTPEQLRSAGEVFISRFDHLHKKKFTGNIILEKKLSVELAKDITLEGTPDCIAEFEGTPSVVDFKTSNYAYNKDKIIVNAQMPLYAHMANLSYGLDIKQLVYVVFVKLPEPRIQILQRDITKKDIEKVLANTVQVCNDLIKRKTYPKNTNSCVMGTYNCEFFNKCWRDTK